MAARIRLSKFSLIYIFNILSSLKLFEIALVPLINGYRNIGAFVSSLHVLLFLGLQHFLKSCFQTLLPIFARGYDQVFGSCTACPLVIDSKYPLDCVANILRRLLVIFLSVVPFIKWKKPEPV